MIAPLEGMRAFRFESSGTSNTETSMRSPAPSVRSAASVGVRLPSASGRDTAAGAAADMAAGDDGAAAVSGVGWCCTPAHAVSASMAITTMEQHGVARTSHP